MLRQKERRRLAKEKEENSAKIEDISPAINMWTEELYLEKGDRTNWYKVTIFFKNDVPKEYDFYSYNDKLTKEFILNDRFYVNEFELLIVDESGEHYINRKNIEQIDFLQRRLFVDSSDIDSMLSEAVEQDVLHKESADSAKFSEELESSISIDESNDGLGESVIDFQNKPRFTKIRKDPRPSLKKMEAKTINLVFLFLLVIVVGSGLLALIRTIVFDYRIVQLEASQQSSANKENEMSDTAMVGYPYGLNLFMQTFIEAYIPLSNDSSEMEKRVENLNRFFSAGLSLEREVSTAKRELISSELAGVEHQDNYSTVHFRILYSLEIPEEKTRELPEGSVETYIEYQTSEHIVFLALDFIQEGKQFAIVSYPYFKEETLEHLDIKMQKEEAAERLVAHEELESVRRFLTIFLDKYAGGTKDELSYLMNNAESMGGGYRLKELNSVNAYSYEEFIIAYVEAVFIDDISSLTHKEVFSIKLIEDDGQFKASELRHNLGGIQK